MEFTYLRPVPLQITADEVLREFGTRPHLLLRIAIRGDSFPLRALEPAARIAVRGKVFDALFTEADEDERGMRAYVATDVPLAGTLTVGYATEVTAVIPLTRTRPRPMRLDKSKIEAPFHRVTMRDRGAFQSER